MGETEGHGANNEAHSLTAMVEAAEQGSEFTITRNGQPVAVIVGWERWQELQAAMAVVVGAETNR